MIRILVPLLLALAACGVEGPPVPPSAADTIRSGPSITVSGNAEFGIDRRF